MSHIGCGTRAPLTKNKTRNVMNTLDLNPVWWSSETILNKHNL